MVKLFFVTFFIAELIIVLAIILKIWAFDKKVRYVDSLVLSNKSKIKTEMCNIREFIETFSKSVVELKLIVKRKRQECIVSFFKTISFYLAIFMLKGKYKKAFISYQFVKEVIEGVRDAKA